MLKEVVEEIALDARKGARRLKAEWENLAPGKHAEIEERVKRDAERLSAISALDPGHRLKARDAIEDCTRCLLATKWRRHPLDDPFFERNHAIFGIQAILVMAVGIVFVVIPSIAAFALNIWTATAFILLCGLCIPIAAIVQRLVSDRYLRLIRAGLFALLLVAQLQPAVAGPVVVGLANRLKAAFSSLGSSSGAQQLQAVYWEAAIGSTLEVLYGVSLVWIVVAILGWIGHKISGQSSHAYSATEAALSLSIYQLIHLTKLLDDIAKEGAYISSRAGRGLVDELESAANILETVWVKSQKTGVRRIDREIRQLGDRLAFRIRQFKPRAVLGGDKNLLDMRDFFARATICILAGEWNKIINDSDEVLAVSGVGAIRRGLSKCLTILLPVPAAWILVNYTSVLPAEAHGLVLLGSIIFTLVQIAAWLDPGAVSAFEVAGKVRELLQK
ncbi:hypothetical protein EDD27_0698 [Nonomuraea polychroma]|uniref:Uncharacterized protein n=2 Tax=Nonomuraea polychroma TaxID=46176 RepID=A0A438LYM0_9ACTN|nr:hypothetical protein EDD27_0698 [Nonomuraea polychroma]